MEHSLNNLLDTMQDIRALLDLSSTEAGREHALVIYRSAVVLMVASWEQYVEQLAQASVSTLTVRLRDATPLPRGVKQSIAMFSVEEERGNPNAYSDSVWQFADKGWKGAYISYCEAATSKLNTASPANVRELYQNILGIRDVTIDWCFEDLLANDCSARMADLVNLRHDIAHGANNRVGELAENYLRSQVEFMTKIVHDTYKTVFDHTAELSCKQAIPYSLRARCFRKIIALAAQKRGRVITVNEIKKLGTSAQGNHNKLCYEPWGLLSERDRNSRYITDKLTQFSSGEISLPLEILVFDNQDAIPAPNTRYVLISDLN